MKFNPFKNLVLDPEEKQIEEAMERGEYEIKPLTQTEREKLQQSARHTLSELRKNKMISIRLAEPTLVGLKTLAKEEGLPYQTYISSILHKHVVRTSKAL